jgi:ribosomal 50S subunit-recycling heat shock protein
VNGRPAKASYDVKENDVIEITFGQRTLKIRVLDIREHAGKDDAGTMYEVIG